LYYPGKKEELEVGERLREDALDRFGDIAPGVVNGHQHRDRRRIDPGRLWARFEVAATAEHRHISKRSGPARDRGRHDWSQVGECPGRIASRDPWLLFR
jgi:hypothetical protein